MLQAEILVQYGMRNKAVERLQRIQELFPREEERNEDLQRLYMSAGVTPRYAGPAPVTAASPAVAPVPAPVAPVAAPVPAPDPAVDVRSFTRVAEIKRKLFRQGTAAAGLRPGVRGIGFPSGGARRGAGFGEGGLAPPALGGCFAGRFKKSSTAA